MRMGRRDGATLVVRQSFAVADNDDADADADDTVADADVDPNDQIQFC